MAIYKITPTFNVTIIFPEYATLNPSYSLESASLLPFFRHESYLKVVIDHLEHATVEWEVGKKVIKLTITVK